MQYAQYTQSNSIHIAEVPFVDERGVVDGEAEVFAGVYWGYEISETKQL